MIIKAGNSFLGESQVGEHEHQCSVHPTTCCLQISPAALVHERTGCSLFLECPSHICLYEIFKVSRCRSKMATSEKPWGFPTWFQFKEENRSPELTTLRQHCSPVLGFELSDNIILLYSAINSLKGMVTPSLQNPVQHSAWNIVHTPWIYPRWNSFPNTHPKAGVTH
jgi:hypothetical protein